MLESSIGIQVESRVAPCPTSAPELPPVLVNEKPMVLIIMAACTVSTLVTVIFILLIVPRVSETMGWQQQQKKKKKKNNTIPPSVQADLQGWRHQRLQLLFLMSFLTLSPLFFSSIYLFHYIPGSLLLFSFHLSSSSHSSFSFIVHHCPTGIPLVLAGML
ncbi:hypothetical protein FQN60_012113, partial [Etheostoma spectabile]